MRFCSYEVKELDSVVFLQHGWRHAGATSTPLLFEWSHYTRTDRKGKPPPSNTQHSGQEWLPFPLVVV
jgi:hypothetical protein